MTEQTGKNGRYECAERAQKRGFDGYGPSRAPFRAETAVEHDEDEGGGTDFFGKGIIFKVDFKNSFRTEQHTESDKKKQGRKPETGRNFAADDTGD